MMPAREAAGVAYAALLDPDFDIMAARHALVTQQIAEESIAAKPAGMTTADKRAVLAAGIANRGEDHLYAGATR